MRRLTKPSAVYLGIHERGRPRDVAAAAWIDLERAHPHSTPSDRVGLLAYRVRTAMVPANGPLDEQNRAMLLLDFAKARGRKVRHA